MGLGSTGMGQLATGAGLLTTVAIEGEAVKAAHRVIGGKGKRKRKAVA